MAAAFGNYRFWTGAVIVLFTMWWAICVCVRVCACLCVCVFPSLVFPPPFHHANRSALESIEFISAAIGGHSCAFCAVTWYFDRKWREQKKAHKTRSNAGCQHNANRQNQFHDNSHGALEFEQLPCSQRRSLEHLPLNLLDALGQTVQLISCALNSARPRTTSRPHHCCKLGKNTNTNTHRSHPNSGYGEWFRLWATSTWALSGQLGFSSSSACASAVFSFVVHNYILSQSFSLSFSLPLSFIRSLHKGKIEAKKNYTLKPRVVLPDSYVKGKQQRLIGIWLQMMANIAKH